MVLFVHRPEYYHIFQDEKGNDLHGMAQIIIAKHRKGAVGDVLLTFRGEFTRFQNPDNDGGNAAMSPEDQGLIGSALDGGFEDDPLSVNGAPAPGDIPPAF